MIEPTAFRYNTETAENNYFQSVGNLPDNETQHHALAEFRAMVNKLKAAGVRVIVEKDTATPHTPDSIFPNNWISFHKDGLAVVYPMFAENRRAEKRPDIIKKVCDEKIEINRIVDYSYFEKDNLFLEGTGSMILDRVNLIAFAALSERTCAKPLHTFCTEMGYTPVIFKAFQTVGDKRLPIYHTNVVMCVADRFAVVCLECVDDEEERLNLTTVFQSQNKEIIEISEAQMHSFAGNMLQIENTDGKQFLAMSETAYRSLSDEQIVRLSAFNDFLRFDIPTIETVGGGGVRCMMAEIFY